MRYIKKFVVALVIGGVVVSYTGVSYGQPVSNQYAETELELSAAEDRINSVFRESTKREILDLESFDEKMVPDKIQRQQLKKKKDDRIKQLKHLETYSDIQAERSIGDILILLKERKYPINEEFLNLVREIDEYKKSHPGIKPIDLVRVFNKKAGLKNKDTNFIPTISFVQTVYAITYSEWTRLTSAEKLLIVSNPKNALITNSLKSLAFNYTQQKFGYNGLGDKSDGYRHGIWSALMTRDISRWWAELYGNAHEDRPLAELNMYQADGYSGHQHKLMDLDNNRVGRNVIAWYEYFFNCSDTTVKNRISSRLTNTYGNIVWLHN